MRTVPGPIFALLLIFNAFVFPVFRASAALAVEPVQPMALNGNQVADAIAAVGAGVAIDKAFGVQPYAYREFIQFQKNAYETLFSGSFSVENAEYTLESEVGVAQVGEIISGHTAGGGVFGLEMLLLDEVDLTTEDYSAEAINVMNGLNASIHGFVGNLSTDIGAVSVVGLVFQSTQASDGVRHRRLLLIDFMDPEVIVLLEDSAIAPLLLNGLGESGPAMNCEEAITNARNAYNLAAGTAAINYNTCRANAMNTASGRLIGCMAVGLIAAFFASPLAGAIAMGGCGAGTLAALAADVVNCGNTYNAAMAIAKLIADAALLAAINAFGPDCVPNF